MSAKAGCRGLSITRILHAAAIVLVVAALWPRLGWCHADAGGSGASVLRDTEIENDIRTLGTPIWRVAGLDPTTMGIYVVDDSELNSFVVGGQAIFLNSGLIERAETPNMLIGVMAHETGHIAGGHIIRALEAMKNASIETIIAEVVAIAASVPGGSGAPLVAAQGAGIRAYVAFSVAQEATADHAAMKFLDRSGQSSRGLLKFFEILQGNYPLGGEPTDPWARTHPLTEERIDYVRHHVEESPYSNAQDSPQSIALLKQVQLKLHAFLDEPPRTLRAYPVSDQSPDAHYARAIAYYRIPQLDKALPEVDGLIRDFPKNPYYEELKGQMLFENGRIRESIAPYEQAVKLAPVAPLLRIALAQSYVESGDPAFIKRAIAYLEDTSRLEGRDDLEWRLLAVAYGRDNQFGKAALALAEKALVDEKKKDAVQQAQRAKQLLPHGSAAYQRAEEIQREAKDED